MIETVKTNELIRDAAFHARQGKLDAMHVQKLVDAEEAGSPVDASPHGAPVVACRLRKIVVEGWHRIEAKNRVYGADEALILVEWRDYADEAAMYADVLAHGAESKLALSYHNQQSAYLRAVDLGIAPEKVAGLLSVPLGKLEKRVVTAVERRTGNIIPLKAPLRHMAGTQLTEAQRLVNERSDGRSVKWHADQISARVRNDMLAWQDEPMLKSLIELRDLLNGEVRLDNPPGPPDEEEPTGTEG